MVEFTRQDSNRVAFFDYLRALAITFVVVAHYRSSILPGGAIGVSIFFALSGYLICSLLLAQPKLTPASCFRFSARRFLRIYPPYLVSLALIGAVMWFTGDPQLATFVGYLPGLLTFAYRPDHWINMGVGVLWTLHVEFWFYVTFPVLFLLFGHSKHFVGILVALLPISWLATWAVMSAGLSWAPAESPLSALMWMDTLLLGAIVATLNKRGHLTILSGAAYPIQIVCVVSLALIALFSGMSWVIAARMASVLTAVLMAAYLARPFVISMPIVSWIGAISYPIYLLHGVPAGYIEIPWIAHAKSIPLLGTVIIGAALMHYLLEKPAIRLAREITSHDRRSSEGRPHMDENEHGCGKATSGRSG